MILAFAMKIVFYIWLLVLGVWFFLLWKYRKIRHASGQIYGLKYKPLPVIGHLHYVVNRGLEETTSILMDAITEMVERQMHTCCFWLGPFPLIAVAGFDDIQKVLSSTATNEKSYEYEYLKFASLNGIVTAPNQIWRITRSHMNPIFSLRNLEHLMPIFNQNCRELVQSLSCHLDKGPFNVYQYNMRTALQSVCHIIFGPNLDLSTQTQEVNRLINMVERIPHLFIQRLIKPWLWIDSIFEYVHKQDLEDLKNILESFIDVPMREYRKGNFYQGVSNKLTPDENDHSTDGILSLLDVYGAMQRKFQSFTGKDIMAEIMTLYATGTETVGVSLSTCLVALAQHQDIQEKVYNEIVSVVDGVGEINLEDLRKMQYLDQVYQEVLRVSHVVPFIARKCSEDIKLSDCTVPAGNTIAVILCALNMDPEIFPNPKTFDPERFSPENCIKRGKTSFLPFSGGPRNCIGKTYGQLLVKLAVAHVVRRYKLTTDMDIYNMKKKWVMALVSSEGYNIKLQSRN